MKDNEFLFNIIFCENFLFSYNNKSYSILRNELGDIVFTSDNGQTTFTTVTKLLLDCKIEGINIRKLINQMIEILPGVASPEFRNLKNIYKQTLEFDKHDNVDIQMLKDSIGLPIIGRHIVSENILLEDFIPISSIDQVKDDTLITRRYYGLNGKAIFDIDYYNPFKNEQNSPRYYILTFSEDGFVVRNAPIYDMEVAVECLFDYLINYKNNFIRVNPILVKLIDWYMIGYDWGYKFIYFNKIIGISFDDTGKVLVYYYSEKTEEFFENFADFLCKWKINGKRFEDILNDISF